MTTHRWRAACACLLAACIAACSRGDEKAEECDTAGPGAKTLRTKLGSVGAPDADWCQVCVMGPKGYASCQRVFGESVKESRESVRRRARDKACADAGFTVSSCPDSAVIGTLCKGDKPPEMPGGKALQQIYFGPRGKPGTDEKKPAQ